MLLASLVLVGCGAVVGPGGPAPGRSATYDPAADAVLISVQHTVGTVAGVQMPASTMVHGDGLVVIADADGRREARISGASVQLLADRAAALHGLADPGSPVTDMGWTTVTVTVDGSTTWLQMGDVPGTLGGLYDEPSTPEGRSRIAVEAFVAAVADLDSLEVLEPWHPRG